MSAYYVQESPRYQEYSSFENQTEKNRPKNMVLIELEINKIDITSDNDKCYREKAVEEDKKY